MLEALYDNLIAKERYMYLLRGLGTTLTVTFFAVIVGILLGFLVAIVRSTYEKTHKLKILQMLFLSIFVAIYSKV